MSSPDGAVQTARDRAGTWHGGAAGRHAAAWLLSFILAAPGGAAEQAAAPTRARVAQIVETLRQDPDLKPSHTVPMLRWKNQDAPKKPDQDPSWLTDFLKWIWRASRWFADASRWTVWLAGAAALGVLLVCLRYWIRERAEPLPPPVAALPSRVGALDVRPESLPPDIGAAARELWLRGAHRLALSLLYRGALSRLIHDHAVPIRAAHTEPECLALAQRDLDRTASAYFARLVAVWQRAVYGGRDPETPGILALCDEFSAALGLRERPADRPAQP